MCLGIVLQGAGYCKSVRQTVLFKRCTYAVLLFRYWFKRTLKDGKFVCCYICVGSFLCLFLFQKLKAYFVLDMDLPATIKESTTLAQLLEL